MAKTVTPEEFLERCLENQPQSDLKDFSKAVFTSMHDDVVVKCLIHNREYAQKAQRCSLGMEGCPLCNGRIKTLEEFIEVSNITWGKERWDYSETKFKGKRTKLTIICPEHGRFTHLPQSHTLGKNGCGGCNGRKGISKKEFRRRTEEVISIPLDYGQVPDNGIKWDSYVTLTCLRHNISFTSQASSIYSKGAVGCWMCSPSSPMNLEKLIWRKRERGIQEDFDYSNVDFSQGVFALQEIGCLEEGHGKFRQTLDGHLAGKIGCADCLAKFRRTSKGQIEVQEFIEGILNCEVRYNCRDLIPSRTLEIDIFVPSLGVGIEFNGVYYHSSTFKGKWEHHEKWRLCAEQGIRLLQVWEDDWNLKKDIVKKHLAHALKASSAPKVGARQTEVTVLELGEAREFLKANHIQGFVRSSVYLGLRFQGELVAVASFLRSRDNYILTRYATSVSLRGGHSKLVTHFERNWDYQHLITFADLTFGSGELYERTGWRRDKILPPDYTYLYGNIRKHKFGFRKKRFEKDESLVYAKDSTEQQLAQDNGLIRVYDAGKIRFIKPNHH